MSVVPVPTFDGGTISSDMFGGNFLADRYDLDPAFDAAVDRLGVTGLRYPGGALTERLFDITNPNATTARDDDGTTVDFVPLSDFLAYAAQNDHAVTIVLPTREFLSMRSDANGDRFPAFDETALRSFVEDVASGVYGSAEIAAFEIGNEYWGSGQMTAVEYGRLSSRMAEVIDDTLDQLTARTGQGAKIDILVQSGTNYDTSNLSQEFAGQPMWSALDAVNDRFGTDFGAEMIRPQGGLDWPAINDSLIRREFDDMELDAVDGVVTHLYSKEGVQPGQRDLGLDMIEDGWLVDDPDLAIHVTEWNQSAAEPRFDSETDFGLRHAAEVLNTFETMMEAGVDEAHVWPLMQNNRTALLPDSAGGATSPAGELFSWMAEALPGKTMLDFAPGTDETEFQGKTADLHGFYGGEEVVFYLVSTSAQTETHSFDLDTLIAGGGTVSARVLGAAQGETPNAVGTTARVDTVPEDEIWDDGLLAIALDPGEILELKITDFTPTADFATVMADLDAGLQDAPVMDADRDLDMSDIDALMLPPLPEPRLSPDDAAEADAPESDSALDGLAALLGLLPLLLLLGLAGG